jgi:hypothetical protein
VRPLLKLYPKAWRARYEDEFIALLEQNTSTPFDPFDIILGAIDAHLRPQVSVDRVTSERRSFMNSIGFSRLSGLASMIGGALLVIGIMGMSIVSDDSYPYTFGLADVLMSLLILSSLLLMFAGLVGLYAKWGSRTGVLGRASLIVTALSVLTILTAELMQLAEILGWFTVSWWDILMLGLMVLFVGTSLFAIAGLRTRVLTTWTAAISILGGVGAVATMLISMFRLFGEYESMSNSTQIALGASMLVLALIFIFGWVLIGYTLWTNKTTVPTKSEPTTT